jgi:hypothetical protein
VFTQDFFTENATHRQNCTSFNPKRVITYNVNNGKPFLNMSRSVAQIIELSGEPLRNYALTHRRRSRTRFKKKACQRALCTSFFHSSAAWVLPTPYPETPDFTEVRLFIA